ncbi:hypothetical protein PIROE2DRAFT_7713 [Piromyces sp. E2]|nr:hypothetical protein PIROE2DRAFT_7713 [Piromyces sp. E2]|eukprot:OUM65331.1 hypothetical protein PIROE2DRAFT_7713 [Piromyces sp. E2]
MLKKIVYVAKKSKGLCKWYCSVPMPYRYDVDALDYVRCLTKPIKKVLHGAT